MFESLPNVYGSFKLDNLFKKKNKSFWKYFVKRVAIIRDNGYVEREKGRLIGGRI
jgi:hypothetical protein